MGKPASEQLDSSDAIFVDVIHTSANSQEAGVLGPIGNREEVIYSFLLTLFFAICLSKYYFTRFILYFRKETWISGQTVVTALCQEQNG